MRVGIVGLGLIGGSMALAWRQRGRGTVIGVDRDPEVARDAVARGAVDAVVPDVATLAREVDVLVLASPLRAVVSVLQDPTIPWRAGMLVTDAASVKVPVMAAARALPTGVRFVGGHPMAGSERSGLAAARADLFAGATYFCVPGSDPLPAEMEEWCRVLGARPVVADARAHDAAVALTSHLPHAVAALVAYVVAEAEERAEDPSLVRAAAGRGLLDTTRIAAGSPALWLEILLANREPVAARLEELGAVLAEMGRALRQGEEEPLFRLLARACEWRRRAGQGGSAR